MQIITKNENKLLLLIKNNQENYPEKITIDNIRSYLDLSETVVVDLIESLEEKDFIRFESENKEVYYENLDEDVKIVEDKDALKDYMLNKTEEDAYVIIQDVISKYDGYAPRYVLEGALLYGELKLTPKRTYNIMVSLENKQLLRKVDQSDGEYYTI